MNLPTAPSGEQRLYSYDSLDRMVQSRIFSSGPFTDYQLDGVRNRQFTTKTDSGSWFMDSTTPEPADAQMNQYTSTPFGPREYDRNGNTTRTHSATRQYAYDYRNRLVSFTDTGTGQTTTYRYDALGRRIERSVAGTISRYYYRGTDEIEEQDGTNLSIATYVGGEGADGAIQMKRAGLARYLHADDLGNIVLATDASGNVLERYRYADYGVPTYLDPF